MRLSTAVCLSLVLVGLTSGCTTMRNPLASKTDPQDASRRRMIAEMNARTEKGDIEGARKILTRLEASDQAAKAGSTEIPLEPETCRLILTMLFGWLIGWSRLIRQHSERRIVRSISSSRRRR